MEYRISKGISKGKMYNPLCSNTSYPEQRYMQIYVQHKRWHSSNKHETETHKTRQI